MVLEVWKSKARCIGAISITQWCHGGIGVDRNSTGPEKVERAWETCVLASLAYNMHHFALAVFVMPARSGAINLAVELLIHFVRGCISV